jgi:3-hydroxyisobutyrate dehydrogenase-like beta-hydroxyacid dehydrogenase
MTMPADAPRLGVLGCGNMGSAIAHQLASAGHRVPAWNRTASRANALIGLGVDVAPTVQALTKEADVVLAVVSSYNDIRSALSGVEFAPGTVLVNLVTGTPSDAADLQRDLEERGLRYLDGAIASYPEAIGTADAMLRGQNDNAQA